MKIYKTNKGIVIEENDLLHLSPETNWDAFINRDNLYNTIQEEIETCIKVGSKWMQEAVIVAPIQSQELWAAGVLIYAACMQG